MAQKGKTKEELIKEIKLLQARIAELEMLNSDRTQIERALEESKLLLEAVVENIPLMIFLKEAIDLRFVIFNRAGEELLGYARKDLMGKNNLDLFPPDLAANFMTKDREVLNGELGFLDIPEEPIMTAKKGQRLLHTRKVCIRGADGATKYLLGISEDITDLKRMQEKILKSEKFAVIGQLASCVAHELRNPLGVIKNSIYFLNMLELGKDNPDIKEYMDIISAEIENSNKIISNLLEFSRLKQPVLNLEDINSIVKNTLAKVSMAAGIKVVMELGENFPQIQVDAQQMQQGFYNLATNAVQAMEKEGTLTVSSRKRMNAAAEEIEIIFQDTGCGISKENLPKIFEPLFSTKAKGTGLGLSVVMSLVESYGGQLEVESEIGKGSIFTVSIPVKRM